jgi:prefoldin subunit 5
MLTLGQLIREQTVLELEIEALEDEADQLRLALLEINTQIDKEIEDDKRNEDSNSRLADIRRS